MQKRSRTGVLQPRSGILAIAVAPLVFASQKMSYQCEYANPNGYRIQTGDLAAINEICVTVGYYFPADDSTGHFCLGSLFVR
jgi:hypothetical protein